MIDKIPIVVLERPALPRSAADPQAAAVIRRGLEDSVAGWNGGDLGRFVALYSDSPESTFSGPNSVLHHARSVAIAANRLFFTAGHAGERGRLRYEILEIDPVDAGHVFAFVRFELADAGPDHSNAKGISAMLFGLEDGEWKIVSQHDAYLQMGEDAVGR
jgi:hypothetical protein